MTPQVYKFINQNGIYRPFIPVRIINPLFKNEGVMTHAILDTGADACVFPRFIADSTKHDLKAQGVQSHITQGVGETEIQVWNHTFIIELLSPDRKSVVWRSKECLIRCVDHNKVPPLLGFENFMSNFNISFNHSSKNIMIRTPL